MEYAAQGEITSGQVQSSLIESFHEATTEVWRKWIDTSSRTVYQTEGRYAWVKVISHVHNFVYDSELLFLSLAVSYGLNLYVEWKLDQDPQPIKTRLGRPLLNYAAAPRPPDIWRSRTRNPKLIALLLHYGEDPNFEFGNHTTWRDALHFCYEVLRPLKPGDKQELLFPALESIKLLLGAGANPEAYVSSLTQNGSYIPAITVVEQTFGRKFPEEVFEIKLLIRQKLEQKMGPKRAIEIEKHWDKTPQELRRQAERAVGSEKEQRLRDELLEKQREERLALLYEKKTPHTVPQDDDHSRIDYELPLITIKFPWEESLPQTPTQTDTPKISHKKRRFIF